MCHVPCTGWRKTSGRCSGAAQGLGLRVAFVYGSVHAPRGVQGVAKNFREVFRDLAPGGRGELVMQKRLRRPEAEGANGGAEGPAAGEEPAEGDEDEEDSTGASQKYSGVKVRVRALNSSSPPANSTTPRASVKAYFVCLGIRV